MLGLEHDDRISICCTLNPYLLSAGVNKRRFYTDWGVCSEWVIGDPLRHHERSVDSISQAGNN